MLTESSKTKATTSGAPSFRFLWGLGLTAFLLRSLFGNGQGMLVMEDKGTLVGILEDSLVHPKAVVLL